MVIRGRRERWFGSITCPPFVSSLSSCPSSLRVLPPFMSFLPSCPSMRQSMFFSTYLVISFPLLGQSVVPLPLLPLFLSFLPSCPPSLRVLPPFVTFLPSCPSPCCVLPPFMSIDEAEPVLLYLLSDFLSFVIPNNPSYPDKTQETCAASQTQMMTRRDTALLR